ncbi:uncharacterized protein LOC128246851 isoform X2 [Mya arenaria]|uniref:uncharacterized protein LOC128246851 isoform X2 n=1 Tax=Mya arenaria TaxID=6604 RepID=UPI0022E40266|nr:uncharacterized protein LOC128246851 isoform X2 [Mya arenaria]
MAETVSEAVKISKLLGLNSENDYTKYENVKLAAQKRRLAAESNKTKSHKILVTPVRAYPIISHSTPNQHRDLLQSSSRKASDHDHTDLVNARRCKSETKEIRTSHRHKTSERHVENDNIKRGESAIDFRLDRVKEKILQRDPPNVGDVGELNGKRKEVNQSPKATRSEKSRILVRRESPSVAKSGRIETNNENALTNGDVHSTKETRSSVKRGVSPSSHEPGEDAKHHRRQSPVIDKINAQKLLKKSNSEHKFVRKRKDESSERKTSPKNKPMEVRRRLDFEKDETADELGPLSRELDFTDKIAALRSLMNRGNGDGDFKDISDRKAYYNEYRSGHRKVMVGRADLRNHVDKHDENVLIDGQLDINFIKGHLKSQRLRQVHSADIFSNDLKNIDGRLSAVELQLLKDRLELRHENGKDTETEQSRDAKIDTEDDLFHAGSGRKILSSSKKPRRKSEHKMETGETDNRESRPSSRLDSKETQAKLLNSSIRSVQSNVPFFEALGRPMSAPLFNCEIAVGKRNVYKQRSEQFEGIEKGIHVNNVETSPGAEERQTNVNNFMGTSVTPEKQKHRPKIISRSRDLKAENNKIQQVLDNDALKRDSGNHRPSSRNSQVALDDEIKGITGQSNKLRSCRHSKRSASTVNGVDVDKHNTEREISKSEKKVREWIKKQEMLTKGRPASAFDFNSGPVMMEELNISISIPTDPKAEMKHSPSDSCDRIPVKLEKKKNERTHTLGQPTTAIGFLAPKDVSLGPLSNRQAIFDRLERITMAVTTQQHQFEVDIPVGEGKGRTSTPMQALSGRVTPRRGKTSRKVENSDSADTESSVFSLPFSIDSGDSISSTVQAVKLLRKLYNVDTETRQNLVLMAKCFRRWFNNVLHALARNQQIENAANRVSPISYGVMLRKSDTCYRDSLLSQCFAKWRTAQKHSCLHKRVAELRRRHMLKKGMNAFRWAINRSKLQQGILQDRINVMLVQSTFVKWRDRALENRRLRLQQAFLRWRQFTKEAQKLEDLPITPIQRIRMLRNQTNMKLKGRMFQDWWENYQTRLKEHRADRHHRLVVLSQGWFGWRCYTITSVEKKTRDALGQELFRMTLQRKMFTCMKAEFAKFSIAQSFNRGSQLRFAMRAWREGAQVSHTERQNDLLVAEAHWERSTLRAHFSAWRDGLLTNRACALYNNNMLRDAFILWRERYTDLVHRREEVDTYRRHRVMAHTFQHWFEFVLVMKKRRAAAVECIHSVLQRHVFDLWRWYTGYQKRLRKRLLLHVRKTSLDTERRYLNIWRSKFRVRCDEKKAQQLWSNACARKAADIWRDLCHRRNLARLLIDSEPDRQLQTLAVYFGKWRVRYGLIEDEKREALEVRARLDLSQLRIRFDTWRGLTRQLVLIKPMVLRYRQRLVTDCFTGWRQYVVHKAECLKSQEQVTTVLLRNKFTAWRRQYEAHQVEKRVRQTCEQRQMSRCLHAWHHVIRRKHQVKHFHDTNLVRRKFTYWSTLARRQVREKQMQKMERETVMSLLREYFSRWREFVYKQQGRELEVTSHLEGTVRLNMVRMSFTFWRRHFRATLVARENEKLRVRRLAKHALQAWHQHSKDSLQEAVERFAAAIGLLKEESSQGEMIDAEGKGDNYEDDFENGLDDLDLALTPRSVGSYPTTPRTPRTPVTPKHSSSIHTPLRKLCSPSLSKLSLAQSLEFEAGSIISSSFLDARFEMEQAVKTESRREIVVTVVHRLRHWPVAIMFDQWREFTSRQREFKHLTTQMTSVQEKLAVKQYFGSWLHSFREMRLAKQHYDQVLQHKALLSLILYRNSRKQKKSRNQIAKAHFAIKVFSKVFPLWQTKAQEKQQSERIVHLWTNITDEERQLIPRERSFRYKQNRKTLQECFGQWSRQYRKVEKLKKLYHRIILERYFGAWCNWALERHERAVKCQTFCDNRIQKLVFKTWCTRYRQQTEIEQRYHDTWHNYLGIIFNTWRQWAKDEKRCKLVSTHIVATRSTRTVNRLFLTWKTEHQKLQRAQRWHQTQLLTKVVYSWRCVAVWQKDLRQRQLQCQLMSYTCLAKRALHQWVGCYRERQSQHARHAHEVNQRVLRIATHWRQQAQTSRGEQLVQTFQRQEMSRLFTKWKAAHARNVERDRQLQLHLASKHQVLMSRCLDQWRSELMCLQAGRVFNMKLITSLLSAWKSTARGIRERRQSLMAYQEKKDQQVQKVYYLYWFNVAKARKSIRGHANLKIQLNVFKAWLLYTRKQINLRRLEVTFTRKRNKRILEKYWYLVKTRFDYCVELGDMANRVIHEKNMVLMKQALSHWDFRLKIVIADECHEHILAKRTATRWHQFVCRRRQERQHMAQQMERASNFYNKQLCNKVHRSWFNEVLATRHAAKRRQKICAKHARIWKHRVDLAYTAKCLYREKLMTEAWRRWHLEFARYKAIRKVEAFEKRQQLSMVFVSWKNLIRKRQRKISMIPLPVSPAGNMPSVGTSISSAGTSACSTPTDELFQSSIPTSPVFMNQPSQIPTPKSARGSKPTRLHSLSARNSPNGSTENIKLSTTNTGRRGSIY